MEKKAIVLCGGGAKGAYQIGALKALNKVGYKYDIVTGTSVGALNGAFAVMGDIKKAENIWSKLDMEGIFSFNDKQKDISKSKSMAELTKNLIKSGESASYEPLLELIDKNVNEKKIRKSDIEYGFVTTEFKPLKKVEIFKGDIPYGQLKNYIMASAACYPYMKSFKINDKQFLDGGYFDNMPIDMALRKGATDIVVIDLKGIGKLNKANDIPAKVTYVECSQNLGGIMLFNKENNIRNIKLGYLDTLKAFNKLEGNLYSFRKGENIKASSIEDKIINITRKIFSSIPNASSMEKLAEAQIKNCINNYYKNIYTIKSSALAMLEMTADIFKIDYLRTYTFKMLSDKVIVEANKIKRSDKNLSLDIKKILESVLKVDKMSDVFKMYDKSKLVLFIKSIISKDKITQEDKKDIYMLSIAFPETVLAAIFLKAYEESKLINIKK